MDSPKKYEIEKILTRSLTPTQLQITDETEAHRGHMGNSGGEGTHFTVSIQSPLFAGKTLLQQHRLVLDPLAPLFQEGLHSVVVKTTGNEL